MGSVERDPAGILERVPELAEIAEASPAVRRAIEKGKPIAAHRALSFFKWFRAKGPLREKASMLLAQRRLFLEPLTRAPTMITYNGVGARVYGRSERDSDGTYIGAHFIVILFIPVFPLRSYLMADGDTANSYRFIGKVPPTPLLYLWQRALALLAVFFVASAAVGAVADSLHGDLYVVNGLASPVHVEASGGSPFDVPGHQATSVRLSTGKHAIAVSYGGKVIERGEFDLSSGRGAQWWNVVGSALVFVEDVVYVAKGTEKANPVTEPEVHCEPGFHTAEDVKDVFTESPSSVTMSKGESQAVRRRVDMVRSAGVCIEYFASNGKTKEAALLARRTAEMGGLRSEDVRVAVELMTRAGDADGTIALARAARDANPNSLEHNRVYQSAFESLGRRDELAAEYRNRLQSAPNSPDAIYLLARIAPRGEESALLDRGLALAPRHPYLLRARAFFDLHAGDFRRVVTNLTTLREVDLELWKDAALLQVEALATLSEITAARSVLTEALSVKGLAAGERVSLTTAAVELASWDPQVDASDLVGRLDPAARLAVRLDGGLPVSKDDLDGVPSDRERQAYQAALVAHETPQAALDALEKLGPDVARHLPMVDWALLLGEAARTEPPHTVLAALMSASHVGMRRTELMVAFVKSGTSSVELEELPSEMQAAIHLARARHPSISAKERKAELERVKVLDALRGPVSHARDTWKD